MCKNYNSAVRPKRVVRLGVIKDNQTEVIKEILTAALKAFLSALFIEAIKKYNANKKDDCS